MRLHKHTNKTWHSLILIIRVYCFAGIGEGVMGTDPSSGRVKKRSSCSQYLARHGSGQEHCLEKRNWQSLGVLLFIFFFFAHTQLYTLHFLSIVHGVESIISAYHGVTPWLYLLHTNPFIFTILGEPRWNMRLQ